MIRIRYLEINCGIKTKIGNFSDSYDTFAYETYLQIKI